MAQTHAVYGRVPLELTTDEIVVVRGDAVQCSPLVPPTGAASATALSEFATGSQMSVTVHAPPSTFERRRVLALAVKSLAPGGTLVAFAANAKGGTRIADELAAFGLQPHETSKRHHRIVQAARPKTSSAPPLNLAAIDRAIADGEPRIVPNVLTAHGIWSMPGLFNWDNLDTGSALLLANVPALSGRGIDLGCGNGVLATSILSRGVCTAMALADIDRRALDLAGRNVAEAAAASNASISKIWTDVRTTRDLPTGLDFVIMNPPFHDHASEDRALGQAFITRAVQILRPGGQLWMTANRHLPYEATLSPLFDRIETVAQSNGFKVTSARKPMKPMRDPAFARPGSKVSGAFGRKADPAAVVDAIALGDGVPFRRKSKRGDDDGDGTHKTRSKPKGRSNDKPTNKPTRKPTTKPPGDRPARTSAGTRKKK